MDATFSTPDPGGLRYRPVVRKDLHGLPALAQLSPRQRAAMEAVAWVLPFRSNEYVVEELIDWSAAPDDPMFRLTFPHADMLGEDDLARMLRLVESGAPATELRAAARTIQGRMNPHPAGQATLNVPSLDDEPVPGLQHKYRETVLFFPAAGQTCHAYCTYCFRWPQFVGIENLRFSAPSPEPLLAYLAAHGEVSNVLFTGGDPMIMKTATLRRFVEPLLKPEFEHVRTIRIGTKAPAYWPHRFVSDPDADDLLRLFEQVRESGRHLALMAHYSHPRELSTKVAERAVARIQDAGALVRSQAPILRHVNDDAATWAELWNRQVQLGVVPYYMFVERDTGPRDYFALPLARALQIFNAAYRALPGLGRTVRGPSMSATPGKVLVDGVARVHGEKVFVLKLLQARNPDWVGRPFFARYDAKAIWLDDLRPAFGERAFFFEKNLEPVAPRSTDPDWSDPETREVES